MMNPKQNLTEATRQALDAAALGDVEALEIAIAARQHALDDATVPERIKAFKDGEAVQMLLRGMKRKWEDELARLEQIKSGLARSVESPPANLNLRA